MLAIDKKYVLLRRLIVPTHFSGPKKISLAALDLNDSAVIPVTLKESGLKRLCAAVLRFEEF